MMPFMFLPSEPGNERDVQLHLNVPEDYAERVAPRPQFSDEPCTREQQDNGRHRSSTDFHTSIQSYGAPLRHPGYHFWTKKFLLVSN